MALVKTFQRVWGESIVDLTCWRIVGRYGLEKDDTRVQGFALKGGIAAHQRDRLEIRKSIESRSQEKHEKTRSDNLGEIQTLADPFCRHGLQRRKWAEVRKAITSRIRHARSDAKKREEAKLSIEKSDIPTGKMEMTTGKLEMSPQAMQTPTETGEVPVRAMDMSTKKAGMSPEKVESSMEKSSVLHE